MTTKQLAKQLLEYYSGTFDVKPSSFSQRKFGGEFEKQCNINSSIGVALEFAGELKPEDVKYAKTCFGYSGNIAFMLLDTETRIKVKPLLHHPIITTRAVFEAVEKVNAEQK